MPRKPTPQELHEWRESNRFTQVKEAFFHEDSVTETPTPPASAPLPAAPAPPSKAASVAASAPLAPLSGRQTSRTLKPHGPAEATLDLHGQTKLEAYRLVAHFIQTQRAAGRRHVLIITGKGRTGDGVLRAQLPHWLNEPALRPHLSAMAYAAPEKGGNGVMHVLLKKKR